MIKTYEQFLKEYMPITAEAERVAQMTDQEYLDWWLNSKSKKHRDAVIAEVERIAILKIKCGERIWEMLGQ